MHVRPVPKVSIFMALTTKTVTEKGLSHKSSQVSESVTDKHCQWSDPGLGSDNNHQRECFIRWNNSPWNICWLQVGMRHPQELKRRFFMNLLKLTCLPTSLNFDSKSLNLLCCAIIHNTSRIQMLLLGAHLHLNSWTRYIFCDMILVKSAQPAALCTSCQIFLGKTSIEKK